jgi:hypothetical protein
VPDIVPVLDAGDGNGAGRMGGGVAGGVGGRSH